jgi:RNA polymerase sigma-70 factor (ECF subfamily)
MDLIKAARRGQEAAFLQLFDEHYSPLYRFARRLTRSPADAEDIVQECFLELLRPGCSYNPKRTSIRTYLFGVVRNQSLKRYRRREVPSEDSPEARSERSPESQALQSELTGTVAQAVAELPEGYREVLILAHYEQMPLVEIARVLEIELTTVKSRLQRARAQLKEMLAAYVSDPERKR